MKDYVKPEALFVSFDVDDRLMNEVDGSKEDIGGGTDYEPWPFG